ncbi:MAG: Uma2 family endonuclease [Elainellaceae cyanobacterium]
MTTSITPQSAANPEDLTALADELEISLPPTELWSDEPPLESDFHRDQIDLLIRLLKRYWADRTDFYATGNLTIYYSEDKITTRDFRGPDFFVVLDTELKERKSWVVWAEAGKYPNVIIEILSKSTAAVDKGTKKELYQNTFRTPEYFWLDPKTLELSGFRLMAGTYQPIEPAGGKLWSEQLALYLGIANQRLRFFTPDGALILSAEEAEEQERQRAEQEHQRAERLAAKLRELGIDPSQL